MIYTADRSPSTASMRRVKSEESVPLPSASKPVPRLPALLSPSWPYSFYCDLFCRGLIFMRADDVNCDGDGDCDVDGGGVIDIANSRAEQTRKTKQIVKLPLLDPLNNSNNNNLMDAACRRRRSAVPAAFPSSRSWCYCCYCVRAPRGRRRRRRK